MNIGLMGLDFDTINKGCDALSYSFVSILSKIIGGKDVNFYVFSNFEFDQQVIRSLFPSVNKIMRIDHKELRKIGVHKKLLNTIKACDCVFDFTLGDSFTDIYGEKRFLKSSYLKELCILCHTPLILGPQTIGPFEHSWCRALGKHLLLKSSYVCSRDGASVEYVKNICGKKIDQFIDVAFALPYDCIERDDMDNMLKIGFNISGLLWHNGYTGNNEFGLTVDYKKYCRSILEKLCGNDNFEVHLIGHVIKDSSYNVDNDIPCMKELQREFPSCIVAPLFANPIEAKNYIARMDVMLAARMHASIAAFSSGIPVIPFAYSRKVNGLYGSLNYPYFIDGKAENTKDAIDRTLAYINDREELKDKVDSGNIYAQKQIGRFTERVKDIISKI